jgi:hypothetical protein
MQAGSAYAHSTLALGTVGHHAKGTKPRDLAQGGLPRNGRPSAVFNDLVAFDGSRHSHRSGLNVQRRLAAITVVPEPFGT